MSQLFASGGQSIGASASVIPMDIQGWFPLGCSGFISLQSKGLSRVFSASQFEGICESSLLKGVDTDSSWSWQEMNQLKEFGVVRKRCQRPEN